MQQNQRFCAFNSKNWCLHQPQCRCEGVLTTKCYLENSCTTPGNTLRWKISSTLRGHKVKSQCHSYEDMSVSSTGSRERTDTEAVSVTDLNQNYPQTSLVTGSRCAHSETWVEHHFNDQFSDHPGGVSPLRMQFWQLWSASAPTLMKHVKPSEATNSGTRSLSSCRDETEETRV